MITNHEFRLPVSRVVPQLHADFRPAVLALRAFRARVRAAGQPVPVRLAIEQADASVYHFGTEIFPENAPESAANYAHLERLLKFLLWSRGGWRIYFDGPAALTAKLRAHYRTEATGQFDANLVGEKMFDHPLEIVNTPDIPP